MPSFGIEDVDQAAIQPILLGLSKLTMNNPEQQDEESKLASEYNLLIEERSHIFHELEACSGP